MTRPWGGRPDSEKLEKNQIRKKRQLVGKTAHLCKRRVANKMAPFTPTSEPNRETMASEVNPNVNPNPGTEPELHLLLAPDTFEPLWKSLFRGLDEYFFPKKLPPSSWNRSQSR